MMIGRTLRFKLSRSDCCQVSLTPASFRAAGKESSAPR
jgi:hypothetical protein